MKLIHENISPGYSRVSNCSDSSGCETICRCSTVENIHCDQYSLEELCCSLMLDPYNELQLTLVDWLDSVISYKQTITNWTYDGPVKFEIQNGYYGQELHYDWNYSSVVYPALHAIENCDWLGFVRELCLLEYGFLSGDVSNATNCRVEYITVRDITFIESIAISTTKKRTSQLLPPIIVTEYKPGKYKLVDGHHRLAYKYSSSVIGALILS